MYVATNRGQCPLKPTLSDKAPGADDVGVDVDLHQGLFLS
jgi:hypothetical protein